MLVSFCLWFWDHWTVIFQLSGLYCRGLYVWTHVNIYIHTYDICMCVYVCICVCVEASVSLCVYIHIYIYIYIYMCDYMCVCYIYACTCIVLEGSGWGPSDPSLGFETPRRHARPGDADPDGRRGGPRLDFLKS